MPSTQQNPNQKCPQLPTPPITKKHQNENYNHPQGLEPAQTSWADRVRVTNSSTRHTLEAIPQKPPGSRLMIPAKQVLTMADGFFIFQFKSEEDVLEIIEKGPWMFGGKTIILQKWTPQFQFDRSKISHVSVWIRLRGLPLPLWTKQGLSMAASMFEVESPLSTEPMKVTVEYEWKPSRCEACQSFGHQCPTPEKANVGGATLTEGEQQNTHGQPMAREDAHPPADVSPWRQQAEGARQRSWSRPKQREGKQPWIDVNPTGRATKKVANPGHQASSPVAQTNPNKQVSESSRQSTVGVVGEKCVISRKENQLSHEDTQGQDGPPNTGLDVMAGVEEKGSSMPDGSHVSSEGDEPTTTSLVVRKKKSGKKKKGARGL
ncbi:hypothetical protein OIU84_029679 [Salix udensis]|uniref:DUF4283 domain-containing protein n=1 Tax=Salix udensis TaxID=889485 RepID=A0AAD6K9V3_9ROSI|nr:hypothetical protein OIU84_029679 [Salix udensis]